MAENAIDYPVTAKRVGRDNDIDDTDVDNVISFMMIMNRTDDYSTHFLAFTYWPQNYCRTSHSECCTNRPNIPTRYLSVSIQPTHGSTSTWQGTQPGSLQSMLTTKSSQGILAVCIATHYQRTLGTATSSHPAPTVTTRSKLNVE